MAKEAAAAYGFSQAVIAEYIAAQGEAIHATIAIGTLLAEWPVPPPELRKLERARAAAGRPRANARQHSFV